MKYENLTENQKALFGKINGIFVNHNSITKEDFIIVLLALRNKYKKCQE